MVIGDFNSKVQEPDNEEETDWIGEHTFCAGDDTTWQQSEEVENNRKGYLTPADNSNVYR